MSHDKPVHPVDSLYGILVDVTPDWWARGSVDSRLQAFKAIRVAYYDAAIYADETSLKVEIPRDDITADEIKRELAGVIWLAVVEEPECLRNAL